MSLKETLHTEYWNTIPKKCKQCIKSIYTIENEQIYYQCSLFGKFKKECQIETAYRTLPKPEDICTSTK